MTTTKNATTSPEPPAQAVAADPHWSATRDRLRNRQRPIAPLIICDDVEAKKALEEAKFLVRRLNASLEATPDDQDLAKDLAAAQRTLETAQAAFDDVAIVLRFQALRRLDFEELKKAHPPTESQAEDGYGVNPETLGPILIEASSLDGITAQDAIYYLGEWSEGEANALFNTAWNVQANVRMELGKG